MFNSVATSRSELASFLATQLDDHPLLLSTDGDESARCRAFAEYIDKYDLTTQLTVEPLIKASLENHEPQAIEIDAGRSLVVARIPGMDSSDLILISIQEGPLRIASSMVRNAIEHWDSRLELASSQTALEDSAMQLAQSFEEQNWLRGFARNASSLSRHNTANDMANGILQPLGYLLRAQDVFLIVQPDEQSRSGLVDAKYGTSDFSLATIRELLNRLNIGPNSVPLVKNNADLETDDGSIHSLIVVTVKSSEHCLGHLVGINRSTETQAGGLPVYDPEFGSGDVGLIEEAAVLLSTQAHNIHLLIQSNQLFLGTLHAMSSAIDARDPYTQGHSERVARLSYDLATILGLSKEARQEIYLAGILHDIGKIGVPDSVLLKNGPLTDEEYRVIQKHPEIGYRIVEQLGQLQFVLPGVLHHHERWDGRGYPHGLQGESIPLMARIMAVADAFDAMTSSRPYRKAMPVEKASAIIRDGSGQQWDAQIVDCFNLWLAERTQVDAFACLPNQSIIPQDSPVDFIVQAVMTLNS